MTKIQRIKSKRKNLFRTDRNWLVKNLFRTDRNWFDKLTKIVFHSNFMTFGLRKNSLITFKDYLCYKTITS